MDLVEKESIVNDLAKLIGIVDDEYSVGFRAGVKAALAVVELRSAIDIDDEALKTILK